MTRKQSLSFADRLTQGAPLAVLLLLSLLILYQPRLVLELIAIARHLAKEAITEKELRSKLSQQGFENIADVRLAILETDGTITVEHYPDSSEDNRHRKLSNRLNKIEELLS